jgi:hypothetical protein
MRVKLTSAQIKEMQLGLIAQGYTCSRNGVITGSTEQAYSRYYAERSLPEPDLYMLTEVPVFTAIVPPVVAP